ncbi:MAG TPA: YnbE family lipoprotein [Allosphingosinicella sp.]
MARVGALKPARAARLLAGIGGAALLGGCVQVSTPDRPIEVNLNINIRQEVVVRLQQDARELIEREQRDY